MARPALTLTLGGNAAVLLECAGLRVVTDPWLRDRIGPWRRLQPCGFPPEALREVDAVLISHAHPDHLDLPSLQYVSRSTPILTPGGSPYRELQSAGFGAAVPLDDWQEWHSGDLRITATPCVHTRWSLGFALRWGEYSLYFAGDAAPRTPFAEIRERCGPFDLALMPVGGSVLAPGRLQRHLTPELAARATAELQPRVVVPIHWGHVPCVPAMIDRYRGTAAGFAAALARHAPAARLLAPNTGEPYPLD